MKSLRVSVAVACVAVLAAGSGLEPRVGAQGAGGTAPAPAVQPVATIDASRTGAPITPLFYGKFTELLRNMFEKGLWAEMVSDRKFFYPVDSSKELTPPNTKSGFNRWRPIGPDSVITMDTTRAFVGEHSPRVRLDASVPRGIGQAGIPLRKGTEYGGRVALAGNPGARVTVSLVWGDRDGDRQSLAMPQLTDRYTTIPLRFTAAADADNGRLEVAGVGTGSFLVGVVSLMPADNLNGFRRDLVEHLKVLDHGTSYRWPGGNMLAAYDWRDGIGDIDRRPPRYDIAWNTVEYNDVGTDEFLTLCRLLDLSPFMVVNSGFHDEYSAAGWVEYVNGAAGTPMGRLRAANGHPEPYGVVYWGIGNEMYGQWQKGHMSIDHYVVKHARFAVKMRAVDPRIRIVASGANPFETSTTSRHHRLFPIDRKLPYAYKSPEDWSGNLLARALNSFEIISEHSYPFWNNAFDAEQQKFVPIKESEVDQVRRGTNRIRAVAEAWDVYTSTIPGLKEKHITIALDEWATGGGPATRALGAAEGLMEMFRRSEIYELGSYTGFTGCVSFDAYNTAYSPAGLVFRLFREHYGTIPVALAGNAPQKVVAGTIGVDRPAVSSGSETYPLDMTAALSANRRTLTVAVVNPTAAEQAVELKTTGVKLTGTTRLWRVAMADYAATNRPGEKPAVDLVEVPVSGVPGRLTVPPISVSVYAFEAR